MDFTPLSRDQNSKVSISKLTKQILEQLPESRQVPTHSASFLSFYLPESEISNICAFLENIKQNHPGFGVEVLSNNLESAYIEIFSKSYAK